MRRVRSLLGHNGGEYGIAAELFFDRDNDMGMLVLANGEEGTADILELLYDYGLTLSAAGTGNPDCDFINSTNAFEKSSLLSVYPNPATNHIVFESKIAPGTVQNIVVSDLTGRVVLRVEKREEVLVVDVSGLEAGIYFLGYLEVLCYCLKNQLTLINHFLLSFLNNENCMYNAPPKTPTKKQPRNKITSEIIVKIIFVIKKLRHPLTCILAGPSYKNLLSFL